MSVDRVCDDSIDDVADEQVLNGVVIRFDVIIVVVGEFNVINVIPNEIRDDVIPRSAVGVAAGLRLDDGGGSGVNRRGGGGGGGGGRMVRRSIGSRGMFRLKVVRRN